MTIPKEKVLKRLGHNIKKGQMSPNLEQLIDEELSLADKLIAPKKIIHSETIKENNGCHIRLQNGLEIQSSHMCKLLSGCHTAYGFAVTIGKLLEEKRDRYLKDNENTRALVLDSIGSVAVEEYAENTHNEIKKIANKNSGHVTRRFSPGYGDWKLESQKYFLLWLEAEKINIRLTDKYIMIPEKSISALLGVKKTCD